MFNPTMFRAMAMRGSGGGMPWGGGGMPRAPMPQGLPQQMPMPQAPMPQQMPMPSAGAGAPPPPNAPQGPSMGAPGMGMPGPVSRTPGLWRGFGGM